MNLFNKSNNFINISLLILICVLCMSGTGAVPKNHGHFAQKLDEYFSTIKCVANIIEDLMPEYNSLMLCCGVWMMHDMLGEMVLDNCYDHNLHQINNLTEPFIMQMEDNCYDYPRDSYSCKLMVVIPITLLVLIVLLILSLTICAIVTCIRLRRIQKYYEYHKSQGFDSAGTEETTDDPTAPAPEKKKAIDV